MRRAGDIREPHRGGRSIDAPGPITVVERSGGAAFVKVSVTAHGGAPVDDAGCRLRLADVATAT